MATRADGYTAAGDTETTLTGVFDPELQSLLPEGSTHPCKLAPCDLSTLVPPSTVSYDCTNTIFGESFTASCLDGNAAISGTAASAVWTCDSDGAMESDPTFPYPTYRGAFIGDTCRVVCDGWYEAVFNDTQTGRARDNTVEWEGEVPHCLVVTGDIIA